jgi:hypothetical protein
LYHEIVKAWFILLMVCELSMLTSALQPGDATANQAPAPPQVSASPKTSPTSPCTALFADPQMAPLEKVCEFALTFRHNLPDFTCEQTTVSICDQTPGSTCRGTPGSKGPAMQALVTYLNGQEHYSNVTIDGKPVPANEIAGRRKQYLLTRGEFGSDLVSLFTPPIVAEFKFRKETTLRDDSALVYQYHLPADKNTFWTIYDDRNGSVRPELRGELWLEPRTEKLLRLQVEPVHLPPQFDIKGGSTIIDYSEVGLGDAGVFLLPTSSQTNACIRGYEVVRTTLTCVSNVITFQNCHKFTARTRVVPIQ